MKIPSGLLYLASLLPCPLYIVGGYVRNSLLYGEDVATDIDICSPLTVDKLRLLLADTAVDLKEVNPRVGTVLLTVQDRQYEYTTFRRDSYPIGGVHTPASVQFVGTPEEDALRRDFRINAIYCRVDTAEIVDPTEGQADLCARVVSTTRAPDDVFGEDGLRLLRLARFCGQLGFAPHPDTLAAATRCAALLADITPERVWAELQQILMADTRYGVIDGHLVGLSLLDDMDIWRYIAPVDTVTTASALMGFPPHLPLRLAGIAQALARQTNTPCLPFASRWLGQQGLRCSNALCRQSLLLLQAAHERPDNKTDWRLWAATYGDDCYYAAHLWYDADALQCARQTHRALVESGVPLTHKQLPIAPHQLRALGVRDADLGAMYRRLLRWCWADLLCPTAQQCIQQVRRLLAQDNR